MHLLPALLVCGVLTLGDSTAVVRPPDSLAAVVTIQPVAADSCRPAGGTTAPRHGLGWAAYLAVAAVGVTVLVYAATATRSP